jgi:hypothetical protein
MFSFDPKRGLIRSSHETWPAVLFERRRWQVTDGAMRALFRYKREIHSLVMVRKACLQSNMTSYPCTSMKSVLLFPPS